MMNISLHPVNRDEKETLRNLLEKYLYEFSQYENTDVNELGLYGYDYLDNYWAEANRFPFFIKVDGKLAGFIMVNDYPEINIKTDYTLSEMFVMYKYRNMGVGAFAVKYVFDTFRGKWQLKRHPKNVVSVRFWDKVISEYTGGKYELAKSHPQAEYADGTKGDVLIFET
jgi:predicted acetyltransferase